MSVEGLSVLAILSVCLISVTIPVAAVENAPDILYYPSSVKILQRRKVHSNCH